VDFFDISNVYVGKMLVKAAKSIFNSDKMCRSYSDLNFGVTFSEHCVKRMSPGAARSSVTLTTHQWAVDVTQVDNVSTVSYDYSHH